jgi:hypothetical protein
LYSEFFMFNRVRRGAYAIEFGMLLPLFCCLFSATLDTGWVSFTRSVNSRAIAEGCRTGALVNSELGSPAAVAEEAILASLAVNGQACDGDCDLDVQVVGTAPHQQLSCEVERSVPALVGMMTSNIEIAASHAVRLEWQGGAL